MIDDTLPIIRHRIPYKNDRLIKGGLIDIAKDFLQCLARDVEILANLPSARPLTSGEYARRVMFRGAFTHKMRVALKHMVRASSIPGPFSPSFDKLVSFSPMGRRRINKIPRTHPRLARRTSAGPRGA